MSQTITLPLARTAYRHLRWQHIRHEFQMALLRFLLPLSAALLFTSLLFFPAYLGWVIGVELISIALTYLFILLTVQSNPVHYWKELLRTTFDLSDTLLSETAFALDTFATAGIDTSEYWMDTLSDLRVRQLACQEREALRPYQREVEDAERTLSNTSDSGIPQHDGGILGQITSTLSLQRNRQPHIPPALRKVRELSQQVKQRMGALDQTIVLAEQNIQRRKTETMRATAAIKVYLLESSALEGDADTTHLMRVVPLQYIEAVNELLSQD